MAKEETILAEVARIKNQVLSVEKLLSNENFIKKASEEVILSNKKKLSDFNDKINQRMSTVSVRLKSLFVTDERIRWHVEYMRDGKYFSQKSVNADTCKYDEEYFNYVYCEKISDEELCELFEVSNDFLPESQWSKEENK